VSRVKGKDKVVLLL